MTEVVITGAARTPVGAFLGGLSSVPASYLGEVAIKAGRVVLLDPELILEEA